jgi:hypothetical protein
MRINPDQPAERSGGGTGEDQASTAESRPSKRRIGAADLEALLDLVDKAPGDVDLDPAVQQHMTLSKHGGGAGKVLRAYRLAQQEGIGLTPRDFARALGEAHEPPMARLGQAVKGRLPVLTSRSEKLDQLGKELRRVAQEARKDRFTCERLSTWFSSLSEEERARVTVVPLFDGVGSWLQPLAVRVGHDATKMFNAGHVPTLPPEVVAALPADQQEWLQTRRETLRSLGIDTGLQTQRFFEKHFDLTPVDVDGELPFELARLCELEPALPDRLRSLQEHGVSLYFIKAKLTPDAVLDAVRNLAKSQRAFVSNWLGNLIENGDAPTLTAKDFDDIAKGHLKAYRKAHKRLDEGSLEAQLTDAELQEALDSRLDFVGSAELIRHFSGAVMGMGLTGGGSDQHAALEQINDAIHEYFGSEWANRRVGLDDSWRVGGSVRETLMTLLWLAPAAEVVQRVLRLDGLAKFMAGSIDNVVEEFKGSIPTLLAAGVPTSDVVKRAGSFAPVVAADLALSFNIDEIQRTLGPHIAGGAFSLSAVMLPLFTSLYAVQYFASQYRQLDREGKLPDGAKLSNEQREALDDLASKDGLIRVVSAALEKYKADAAVREGIVAAMQKMEMPSVNANPSADKPRVGLRAATLKGAKEVMVVNQAQLGLFTASLASILIGFGLGDLILHDATLESILGAAELPLAFASLHAGKLINGQNWKRYVEKREPLGLLGAAATETGDEIASA